MVLVIFSPFYVIQENIQNCYGTVSSIVGDDGVKPAIDGGNTPGCINNNCPGHRVFYLNTANDELRLTNITIQNGYAVRFLILFSHF